MKKIFCNILKKYVFLETTYQVLQIIFWQMSRNSTQVEGSMAVTIPNLTDEQRQELNDICANEELMEFMEAGLPNHGEVEDDEVILARQQQAIAAFSEMPDSFWSFK